mmetsp:Transcript_12440/g.53359  ORF Transcript_12440/g.53359 Transcript_12440/m.53359 type:complete len:264 (+) Transcript_12440:2351-3142(+)
MSRAASYAPRCTRTSSAGSSKETGWNVRFVCHDAKDVEPSMEIHRVPFSSSAATAYATGSLLEGSLLEVSAGKSLPGSLLEATALDANAAYERRVSRGESVSGDGAATSSFAKDPLFLLASRSSSSSASSRSASRRSETASARRAASRAASTESASEPGFAATRASSSIAASAASMARRAIASAFAVFSRPLVPRSVLPTPSESESSKRTSVSFRATERSPPRRDAASAAASAGAPRASSSASSELATILSPNLARLLCAVGR